MKLKPLDFSMGDDMSMYDKLPYKRDSDRCNAGAITLCTGNILKYYRCYFGEILKLDNIDDLASVKIQEHLKEERKRLASLQSDETDVVDTFIDDTEDGISIEQIQSLIGEPSPKRSFLSNYDDEDD